ncbi:hypothetical protein D3C85_1004310 [compost metagenome]
MNSSKNFDSHTLSEGKVWLAFERSGRRGVAALWSVLCLAVGAYGLHAYQIHGGKLPWAVLAEAVGLPATQPPGLSPDQWQEMLEQSKLGYEIEAATTEELKKQLGAVVEELKKAKTELAFCKSVGSGNAPKTN